eukprot:gene4293-4511_t
MLVPTHFTRRLLAPIPQPLLRLPPRLTLHPPVLRKTALGIMHLE